ncbi:protein kinase domain-containing protein [Nodosilinea sp. PGN35]|uniref:serine/threonine-protein kinase n=1 Tax=Nodosilinea sp. PGN35 TaxID=3020489 RepID=UPI0023B32F07|nr:serine/threonine-protein kinase [Nodosilinea sp. TSF1-S3]MDF0368331.1 serine/threonine protein kinase [Nodosilinea sp. TSF1-S3]
MTTFCTNPACPQPNNGDRARVCTACGGPLPVADRYCCQQLLGQGGFGRTYLALDERGQPPAVCVVKQMTWAGGDERGERRDRFHREADRLATLGQHPQIPALLDVIDGAQGQFLVQEYIPGPNLDQLMQKASESGGEALVQRVLYELLPVLAYIHGHRVIHRDIKPANIVAPPAPQPLVLVDFGSAKAVSGAEPLKQTATVIGSAGYAAPEQALGKAVFASDIFSLGVTCLHLLTGLHPFDLYSVSDDAWVWQSYLTSAISPALARVLDRMVNRRLPERYGTAQAVLADLRWSGLVLGDRPAFPTPAQAQSSGQPRGAAPVWEQRFALSLPGIVANGLAISPNGRAIATACADGTVRLWDCTNGAAIHTFRRSLGLLGPGHRGVVNAVVFTPAGDAIVSGGEDSQLIRWSLETYTGQQLPVSGWQISALAWAPPGDTLAVGSGDGRIYLWPLDQSAEQKSSPKTLVHHQDRVTALAVNGRDNLLVSGGRDRTLRLWSLPSGRLSRTLSAPAAAITALACHPHDGSIVSGDQRGHVQVWRSENPEVGLVIHRAPSPVTALAISPSGDWLAIGAEDGQLTLMNLQGLGFTAALRHAWSVRAIAFTPDSRMLVSTSADETIRFWCLAATAAPREFQKTDGR